MALREISCAAQIAGELRQILPRLTDVQARAIADFVEAQVRAENRAFNAWMMLKILMRLHDATDSKVVAASLAIAVKVTPLFIKRMMCQTAREAAAALGIRTQDFNREVNKSAAALEMKVEK